MSRSHLSLATILGLLGCMSLFGPSTAKGDPIPGLPTVDITSAAGYVAFGYPASIPAPGKLASLSSPDFQLSFGVFVPSNFFIQTPGTPMLYGSLFGLNEEIGAPAGPSATLELDGTSYPLQISVYVNGGPFTVPSGYATIQIPATVTGSGVACTATYQVYSNLYTCFPPPSFSSTLVANVNLDVPGYLTFTFQPSAGPGINNESFNAVFSPVPEPSTALLLLAVLPLCFLLRGHAT